MASYSRRNFIRQSVARAAGMPVGRKAWPAATCTARAYRRPPNLELGELFEGPDDRPQFQRVFFSPGIFLPSLSSTITIRWDTRAGCK